MLHWLRSITRHQHHKHTQRTRALHIYKSAQSRFVKASELNPEADSGVSRHRPALLLG